jgi:LemA protein
LGLNAVILKEKKKGGKSMDTTTITLGVIGLLIFISIVLMYNTLIMRRNRVNYALSSIDALLKKRYDLIPNLVNTVKQYMRYEQSLLNQLTELRTRVITGPLQEQERRMIDLEVEKLMRNILAIAENYPELKASSNFLQLQVALNEVEEQLSAARRALSASITEYNNAVKTFPTNIVAKLMNFEELKWYEISEEERKNIDVKNLFNSEE